MGEETRGKDGKEPQWGVGVWGILDCKKKEGERLNGRGGVRRGREAGVDTGNRR